MVCPNCGSSWWEGANTEDDRRRARRMRLRPSVWRTAVERGAVCPTCLQTTQAHEAPVSKDRKLGRACMVAPLATPLVIDVFSSFEEGLPRENILRVVIISSSLNLPFVYAAEIFLGLATLCDLFALPNSLKGGVRAGRCMYRRDCVSRISGRRISALNDRD